MFDFYASPVGKIVSPQPQLSEDQMLDTAETFFKQLSALLIDQNQSVYDVFHRASIVKFLKEFESEKDVAVMTPHDFKAKCIQIGLDSM